MKQQLTSQWKLTQKYFGQIFFSYSYEEEDMSSQISSDKIEGTHFHSIKLFIGDLCAVNDCGEHERSVCNILPKKHELYI